MKGNAKRRGKDRSHKMKKGGKKGRESQCNKSKDRT